MPLSDLPIANSDNDSQSEWIESAYLQDEWRPEPTLVLNYGLRFDPFSAYTSASQISPRLNAVWQALPDTTVHTGFSR
jgi:outer membrane receptor for ferrienterochelin and colicins